MYKVYRHTSPSGKVYIGITKLKLQARWKNGNGYKTSPYFYRAIQKYGWDSFKHEVLFDNLNEISAKCIEVDLIYYYKQLGISYNNTDGGEGNTGNHKPKSTEHKLKISISNQGKHNHIGINNPHFNKPVSEETRNKISNANKGKTAWNKGLTGFKKTKEEIIKNAKAHYKRIIDDLGNIFESRLACAEYYKHSPTWVGTRIKDGRFRYV